MELHVLGADGGELLGYKPSGFLFGGKLLLDAGSICSALSLDEILAIDHIFISHTHLDHIKDLGLMADLLTGQRDTPVNIYGSADVIHALKSHYFNNKIWPDFTRIPHPNAPVLKLIEIQPLKKIKVDQFTVLPVPVNHTVDTCGFLVTWDNGSLLYSADTGPTHRLWDVASSQQDLKGLILDVAFPTRMQWIADLSGHLTPRTASQELRKLTQDIPVFFFHLKPAFHDEMVTELKPLMKEGWRVLRSGERIEL
ncbi:MAG: 3',5'-cyclic-nucleotide phosphodiesterase [Deltaproteobacteria bacterium]|nr:3',5'-cyclic-nucleotide phosphodiesterase [Deltaproteobacteria bacterium]|tara:strand:- start:15069 stop:15830 length:762 start_codon:yes stop_codon:yes gene_type:complete